MRVGIVGGGILGLTLGYRLGSQGHEVKIFEASPFLGGLACSHDYGPFVWDRFYHCILPTDGALIGLLADLGLASDLRWTQTGTGYYARGRFHDMNTMVDYLRFPLLSWIDKARLGATVLYATRFADPWALYRLTAEEWLVKTCGRRGYEAFWRPLLRAKFGTYADRVAAVYIWATLTRLTGARSAAGTKERLGYARGGYSTILGRFEDRLRRQGATLHTGSPVNGIRYVPQGRDGAAACELVCRSGDGPERIETFDQVFFTGPTRIAAKLVDETLAGTVERAAQEHPTSATYLGQACLVLALKRPLTRYYVLNIGDEDVPLTGVVEMTNLVDRDAETNGLSLVYLPQYMDSEDPRMDEPDEVLSEAFMELGLRRLFPDLRADEIVYQAVHRARFVQPLPLARANPQTPRQVPPLEQPFQVLNTSMLTCATLNNNEVVGLVDRFIQANGRRLRGGKRKET